MLLCRTAQHVPLATFTPASQLAPTAISGRNVSMEEQRRVLMKRRGSVVGRRSILKSYSLPPGQAAQAAGGNGVRSPLAVEGVTDIRWGSCRGWVPGACAC